MWYEAEEVIFTARDCEASHRMIISIFFFNSVQQIHEQSMIQIDGIFIGIARFMWHDTSHEKIFRWCLNQNKGFRHCATGITEWAVGGNMAANRATWVCCACKSHEMVEGNLISRQDSKLQLCAWCAGLDISYENHSSALISCRGLSDPRPNSRNGAYLSPNL